MNLKPEYIRLDPEKRLYKLGIPVIGLTGGIATGKTTVSEMFMAKNLAVVNADLLVKKIYAMPSTKTFVQNEFPDVMEDGEIQFPLLRQKVFADQEAKKKVEDEIYKHLFSAFKEEFKKFNGPKILVYDVPLLFERSLEDYCDVNVLVYAPREIQLKRLMQRDGSSENLANSILDQQMDIEMKRKKAQFIIENSGTKEELVKNVENFLHQILT